jgi:uncharacterized protein (TIGR03083 family)
MSLLTDDRFVAELRGGTAELAGIVCDDQARPVPTCPGWTFRELATHVGRGHRWAAELVATRAAGPIPMREVPDGKLPGGPGQQVAWLNAAADLVAAAVAAAGDEQVWTFVGSRPARFWLRRRAHETAVHLADAQLASGREPGLAADLAADGVGEWLDIITSSSQAAAGVVQGQPEGLRGDGQTLHFHATDPGLAGAGEWLVRRLPSGVTAEPGHAKADVAVRGPAARLLLVLTRRLPPTDPAIEVLGDQALFGHWLAQTPF